MIPADGAGRLVVCPTPIGNLGDVTLRALDVLREADAIACEDTRRTKILLERYEIEGKLVSFHEHNEEARARELVGRIENGETVVLVSDAGTPLVSDPGYSLLRACIERDLRVEVLPGASSVSTALVASGLRADRWRFVGFLPRKRGESLQLMQDSENTLVAFESPARLASTLTLLAGLDGNRTAAVCRELTKVYEEVRRGTVAELAAYYAQHPPRGEIVLVLAAATQAQASLEDAVNVLRELVDSGARPRTAAAAVARLTGLRANQLYRELAEQ